MSLAYNRRSAKVARIAFCTLITSLFLILYSITIRLGSEHCSKFSDKTNNFLHLSNSRFDTDSRRMVRIYNWLWQGDQWDEIMDIFDICLSTQCSLDRIASIPELVQNWQGPVSLAVFIPNQKHFEGLNQLINFFRMCYSPFRKFVSVHIAVPFDVKIKIIENLNLNHSGDCTDTTKFIKSVLELLKPQETEELIHYPQNHMRNIARKACGTDWFFSTDIDIIPRPNSAKLLQQFYSSDEAQCKKCAFVIPTFELELDQPYPTAKMELLEKLEQNLSRPFHFDVFADAHNATDYLSWTSTNLHEEPIKISNFAIPSRMDHYEPFYISSTKIPQFDERFIGYGLTRSSQIQEALAEGWVFRVLTPIFAIHWGLQNKTTLINPRNQRIIRRKQTFWNGRIFKRFMKELELRKTLQTEEQEDLHMTTPDFERW